MTKPKNPFKKWLAVPQGNKTRFFLCMFDKTKIHAATMVKTSEEQTIYYIKNNFMESYPQLIKHTGEPSFYSFDSVAQWLHTITTLSPEAFTDADTIALGSQDVPTGQPWCYVLFCSNKTKQEISATVFNSMGFQDGMTIKLYHGLRCWEIKIKDMCFEEGWETYCAQNLIDEANMLFLRIKGNLSYDTMAFCTSQSHILMPWTLPLPMLPSINLNVEDDTAPQVNLTTITSCINQFFKHDWSSFVSFYQFYTPQSKYSLELPQYADIQLNENRTPTIILTSGYKSYAIGMKQRSFHQNWNNFVTEHSLRPGELLLFLPQSHNSFAVVVFNRKGIEKMYPWHFNFQLQVN